MKSANIAKFPMETHFPFSTLLPTLTVFSLTIFEPRNSTKDHLSYVLLEHRSPTFVELTQKNQTVSPDPLLLTSASPVLPPRRPLGPKPSISRSTSPVPPSPRNSCGRSPLPPPQRPRGPNPSTSLLPPLPHNSC